MDRLRGPRRALADASKRQRFFIGQEVATHQRTSEVIPMMDRALLLQQLEQSGKRIEAGVQKVTTQRETIAGLAADGHDTVAAKRVLADFEQAQAMSLAHYERIEIELARTKW